MQEREKRTAKGLCFNYDERFSLGYRCKGKLFRLNGNKDCLIEMIEPSAEVAKIDNFDGEMEISMHALSGSFDLKTVCLAGAIQRQQLSMLVDSGSTHNFIQRFVAHKLGIAIRLLPKFRIFIGSDDFLV